VIQWTDIGKDLRLHSCIDLRKTKARGVRSPETCPPGLLSLYGVASP
jgi:hypothetical protein